METSKRAVKCGVEDCQYNKSNLCQASNLVINPMGDNVVETNAGTQCDTFKSQSAT
ncbi:protein of unknown function [Sporobacter termitidis DSM 10068]|uniref:DUF1540 domain-containing protein n=1 Tax=Sporobacter termitidis DSM 10068 TaxID=1123282 RepID=A0A1M5YFS7_9FIRM|nr:DUF1540 domain-containing protein [Sporobacter termitidis]SHI10759.1 protein of unknown function [Sporobacter termitidis DSM 10068]